MARLNFSAMNFTQGNYGWTEVFAMDGNKRIETKVTPKVGPHEHDNLTKEAADYYEQHGSLVGFKYVELYFRDKQPQEER